MYIVKYMEGRMLKLYWVGKDSYLLMLANEIVYGDKTSVEAHLGKNHWRHKEIQKFFKNSCKLF